MKSVPFKLLCLILTLLFQIRGGTSILCYFCNTRDHLGCHHLRYGDENSRYVEECDDQLCHVEKGQWGFPGDRKVLLWRGCGPVTHCSQETALCCHCNKDYCNFDNQCFRSRGHLLVPGIIVFSTQIFIIVTSKNKIL